MPRTATTVRHTAIQVPFGDDAKKAILEDIIAVEISKDVSLDDATSDDEDEDDEHHNAIAAAAIAAKSKSNSALQQKIFGKTIVFTETKAECDELVSGSVFKTLTAQAIHGDTLLLFPPAWRQLARSFQFCPSVHQSLHLIKAIAA